jgi:hypothetical protein
VVVNDIVRAYFIEDLKAASSDDLGFDFRILALSDKSPAISSHFSFTPLTSPQFVRYDKNLNIPGP